MLTENAALWSDFRFEVLSTNRTEIIHPDETAQGEQVFTIQPLLGRKWRNEPAFTKDPFPS
jgi:hypothetical protein